MSSIERAVRRIKKVLGHFATRLVLSGAIILSLVPHESLGLRDEFFMLVFIPEFLARMFMESRWESVDDELRARDSGWKWPSSQAALFLFFDFVALLSFLPSLAGGGTARWFRLFRLTRMIMLVRYWAPLLRDLWAVLVRNERSKQIVLMGMAVVIMSFAGAVVLNHATDAVGDDYDGDGNIGDEHDHQFWVRVWWAFRQVQDPGNLLASPHEAATLIISISLTAFGLFLVSFLIGLGTDVVAEVMELTKLRPANMRRHTVVVHIDANTRQLLFELIRHARKRITTRESRGPFRNRLWQVLQNRRAARQFVVVGRDADPPVFLREPELARIVYRQTDEDDDAVFMERADVPFARRIVLMADPDADDADDETIHTLVTLVERLREIDERKHDAQLVAEVLDESNVMAARRAINRASGHLTAHVVPTERLLALFAAAVTRRAGVGRVLLELLNASGRELYTHTYDTPRQIDAAKFVAGGIRRGVALDADRRVLPIGVLVRDDEGVRLRLNPSYGGGESIAGFVAIARGDDAVGELDQAPDPRPTPATAVPLRFESEPALQQRSILVCGFRSASVRLIEALAVSGGDARLMVLVRDEEARVRALDAFDSTMSLIAQGTLRGQAEFEARPDGSLRVSALDGSGSTLVQIAVGDWTSSRQMRSLPNQFGSVADQDAVLFIVGDIEHSDARTTTALMKLEQIFEEYRGPRRRRRIIAETVSTDLAERLHLRYRDMELEDFFVYSVQEIRALLLFQSVVVPHFDLIYEELVSPWRPSFARHWVTPGGSGSISFAELSRTAAADGILVVGIEMADPQGRPVLRLAEGDPRDGDLIDVSRLRAVWALEDERRSPASLFREAVAPVPAPVA